MFEQAFESMLRKYGSAIDEKKRFTGLVKDYFPDQAKNINLLLMAYNMDIAQSIRSVGKINNTFAFRFVKQLMDEFGLSQEEVAQRVSKSRSAVANSLRLLKLEENVQKMVIDGQITMGHARALLPLEIPEEQLSTAQEIVEKQLSVRETEKKVKEILGSSKKPEVESTKAHQQEEDPSIAIIYKQIEERLQQTLHTKVSIQRKRNGHGKLLIDFYNSDDLEKIIDKLTDR